MYNHILISTDGSDLAQKGVDYGLTLAKSLGSSVDIITVTEPYPVQSAATLGSWTEAQGKRAGVTLDAARDAAAKAGVKISVFQVANSSPAEAIVEISKQRGCDLIVMASHGRRGVSRLLLGSQTAEVVHYSTIPVLVVR